MIFGKVLILNSYLCINLTRFFNKTEWPGGCARCHGPMILPYILLALFVSQMISQLNALQVIPSSLWFGWL